MIRRATIAGILFSMAACLRAACGMSVETAIAIAQAEQEAQQSTSARAASARPARAEVDEAGTSQEKAGGAGGSSPTKAAPPAVNEIQADQQPTPMACVTAGLNALGPLAGKRLVVYGSGLDARWEITAARREPTLTVVGIEIDPDVAESARRYVKQAGLENRVTIITGDATTSSIRADLGAAYLWPDTLSTLRPKIQQLERFVSFSHAVPGLEMSRRGDLYIYEKPQPPIFEFAPSVYRPQNVAVWNGRTYTRPVCSNSRCSMCRSIRNQLAF